MRLVAAAEMFCTIMSRLICASARASKMRAASPTLSGTPTTVILASLRSWATPAMMGCSMVSPSLGPAGPGLSCGSLTTQVPSSWLNDERTWIGMP